MALKSAKVALGRAEKRIRQLCFKFLSDMLESEDKALVRAVVLVVVKNEGCWSVS